MEDLIQAGTLFINVPPTYNNGSLRSKTYEIKGSFVSSRPVKKQKTPAPSDRTRGGISFMWLLNRSAEQIGDGLLLLPEFIEGGGHFVFGERAPI